MPLTTDFNLTPYFDDYDEDKKFYRILFRPSAAVQARELTQLQTIQQKQIERFGGHIFKNGSIVEGCAPKPIPELPFVRVADEFNTDTTRSIESLTRRHLLVGETSGCRANLVLAVPGRLVDYPNTNILYVKYLQDTVSNKRFVAGETITVYSADQDEFEALNPVNIIDSINVPSGLAFHAGRGYAIRVDEGIIFQNGFFQKVDPQIALVKPFDQAVGNYVVGFRTVEEIVTEYEDDTLFDNALGYTNVNAPGAHRLKLVPTLVAKPRSDATEDDTFFALFEFSNVDGSLLINNTDPEYNALGDELARRTFDEAGNYVIKPFTVETTPSANNERFHYEVSSGKAYVQGHKVEFLASRKVSAPRAITKREAPQQIITSNYGNYVFVNEVAGVFDVAGVPTVTIYDAAQNAVSTRGFITAAPTGNPIGTAKLKTFVYYDGLAGTATARFRMFLTAIKMDSGKSFLRHAKSIVVTSGTYGEARADIELNVDDQAILYQSGKNSLLFPFGQRALATLRSEEGTINRTQFKFRVSDIETLQANGYIGLTTAPAHAGGLEQIAYSNGAIGDSLEREITVSLTENTYTANLAGTIDVSDVSNTVTGTSTSFDTHFVANDYIRIISGATIDFRRVVSVTNSTSLTIDAPFSEANTSAVHAKFYPAGYHVPFHIAGNSIEVTSNSSMDIMTNLAAFGDLNATQNVVVQHKILRTQAVQAKKHINRDRYVKLYANTHSNYRWNLGLTDVHSIKAVYHGTANSNDFSTSNRDLSRYFRLDNGQRDDFYDHATLILKPNFVNSINNNACLLVELDHFIANTSAGIGFFSVDSYPIDDANTANTAAIRTAEIPVYNGVDLRDVVDFRFRKENTANSAATINTATLNPATTNNFVLDSSGSYIIEPDDEFQADVTYYLGRIDLVAINPSGDLVVVKGEPSESPRTPPAEEDSMVICSAAVAPYPSLTVRENETYNRSDYATKTRLMMNRGYTMKDIGVLDNRIARLEYYTTLNLLEQAATNLRITDASGLDRFKNGMFVDPFNSHAFGKTTDFEYKISIDDVNSYARPRYRSETIDLALNMSNSTGIQRTGRYITRPYTNELYIYQPYATKFRNCAADEWRWNGSIDLYPAYDMAKDEERLPNIDASIDLTTPFQDFAEVIETATGDTIFGMNWGEWRTIRTDTTVIGNNRPPDVIIETDTVTSPTTERTRIVEERTGVGTGMSSITRTQDLGKYVADVTIQPYMRSRQIAFIASGLRPNSQVYPYFDDIAVSEYCAPGTLDNAFVATFDDDPSIIDPPYDDPRVDRVVVRSGEWGDPLVTDSEGKLYGKFIIPEGTFRVGDRVFLLVDVDDLALGEGSEITKAAATFTASNIQLSTRRTTLTTQEPIFTIDSLTDRRVRTEIIRYNPPPGDGGGDGFTGDAGDGDPPPVEPPPVEPPPPPDGDGGDGDGGGDGGEPLGQSFVLPKSGGQSGIFVTGVDLFFKSKHRKLGIKLYLVENTNGQPDSSKIVGFTRVESVDVNVSDDASLATHFRFAFPVFLLPTKDYSFYLPPDGNNPDYRLWMSEIGNYDVITGAQVSQNPYIGLAYRSANSRTWTALQQEDIKFNLYVANFTIGTGTVVFENDTDEFIRTDEVTLANSSITIRAGDEVYLLDGNNEPIANTGADIQFVDSTASKMKLNNSTGNFVANTTVGVYRLSAYENIGAANSSQQIATFIIKDIKNPPLHSIVARVSTMTPLGTTVTAAFRGVSNTQISDTKDIDIPLEYERDMLDYERLIYSYSNEVSLAIPKSLKLYNRITTTNKYVSPVIDLARKGVLAIENIVNNDSTDEHTRYGASQAKYISQNVVLKDGQEAEDLKVYLTGYRPMKTDIEVYCKLLNDEDPDAFDNKVWTKMTMIAGNNTRSSPINTQDWIEFEYEMPTTAPATSAAYKNLSNDGIVEYVDADGGVFSSFKTFAIKIVLLSSDRVFVPRINDVRCIALQI